MDLFLKVQNYQKWLWQKASKDSSFVEQLLRNILQITIAIIHDLRQGQLSLRAMSLVYTTIISLVPLFAISFSVLKGLGAHNQIRPFLLNALDPLGEKKLEITDKIIGFVDNIQVGVLGALGVAILVYTVIAMMQKIEFSFNYVWHVSKARTFAKRFSDYLSVLLVGPVLIFASAAMTTSARSNTVIAKIEMIPGSEFILALLGVILPYLILTLAFMFLYSFVPNTKVKWRAAFISGLMTAFIWKLMGWGFSEFVANSANQTAIYSAFATIIVFMIWIYLVWLVLLVGASIGFYIQYPHYRKIRHQEISLSPEVKEVVALEMMVEVAKRFTEHGQPINTNQLSDLCNQPQKIVEEIGSALRAANLLLNEENSHAWVPAMPLDHISYYDILVAVRSRNGEELPAFIDKTGKQHLKDIDAVLKKAFKGKTL